MPTQSHMTYEADLYRGVLEYEYQPIEWRINSNDPWSDRVRVLTGPVEIRQMVIGPFISITPIKAYVTKHRGVHKTNLRIKKIEKVSGWEEVEDY